jgi:uncharacterized damage-inducible protein DinB
MRESQRIADQLRRAMEGEAWHGPSVLEVLAGLDARQAAARPLAAAHSIWEIVVHIRVWNETVVRRLHGEVVELSPAEDWPTVSKTSDADWEDEVRALKLAHAKAYNAFYALPDSRLLETAPGKPAFHNFYYEMHGLVQHDLYHAGQIAVLKKALGEF